MLEVAKTTSRWIFWPKSKNQIFAFFEVFQIWVQHFFKNMSHKRLKNFFFAFSKIIILQLSPAFSRAQKSLKLKILEQNEYLVF